MHPSLKDYGKKRSNSYREENNNYDNIKVRFATHLYFDLGGIVMKMIYQVEDRPTVGRTIVFALQQILSVVTATISVPLIVGHGLSPSAALFGAGAGTLVYILFTKHKSPVFLGSNFSFLKSMLIAFSGAASMSLGYLGILTGAVLGGLVYIVLSILVRICGTNWIDKLLPPAVIGPTVTLIGLTLSPEAVKDLTRGGVSEKVTEYSVLVVDGTPTIVENLVSKPIASIWIALLCGFVAFIITMVASVYGKKGVKLLPFLIGILSGYFLALVFTVIGEICGIQAFWIIDLSVFPRYLLQNGLSLSTFVSLPDFLFLKAMGGFGEMTPSYFVTILVAFVPVSFVGFAEHIADHKNLSSIIGRDLLTDPGLKRTLLGDGVGSMVGAFFGGSSNTTYGESIGCVALSRNASIFTTVFTSVGCMLMACITPIIAFLESIPPCIMGGVCIAMYGFICVSGFAMIQSLDFNKDKNIYIVSAVLVTGVGGLQLTIGDVTLTEIAVALIFGVICNLITHKAKEEET